MGSGLSRRAFLERASLLAAAPWIVSRGGFASASPREAPRVVHAHHGRAARWPRSSGLYRDHVDQEAVTRMLDTAVRELEGGGLDESWRAVFPLDAPESRYLAIKVNCNNALDPVDGAGNEIDAIPEPVVAVIGGFVRAGGRSAHCHVYDVTSSGPTRHIAEWFRDKVRAHYPDVQFNGSIGGKDASLGWDPRTHVTWSGAYVDPPPETRISQLALDADYLVNVPIVKRHSQANVTLGYKNLFGSIEACDRLHPWVYADVPEASVLADIAGSPVVGGDPSVKTLAQKTALVVGDMLYGQPCTNFNVEPRPWEIFDNEWPNGLVVSDDPVAADAVMLDLLEAEPAHDGGCGGIASWARRYLDYAEMKGQGIHDAVDLPVGQPFDPALMSYSRIDYRYAELWPSGALLTVSRLETGGVLLEWDHYFDGLYEVHRARSPHFADAELLGVTPTRQYVDPAPPEPSFYRVLFAG
jgi:hypothetical protein